LAESRTINTASKPDCWIVDEIVRLTVGSDTTYTQTVEPEYD